MHITPTLIIGLALFIWALNRVPEKYKPVLSQRLKSWRTVIALLAIIMALFIVLNPELYPLGILGDSAFFDLMVLGLSLQMQESATRVWRRLGILLARFFRYLNIPSPGLRYLLAVSSVAIGIVVSEIQKIMYRLSS